ncbi:hypothetical protein [Tropicimonas sediminicola]|uniref:Uncharacterized protein n=1 Tax=Tropicimonas sediminicola TaxID=1031541 RepID=A0A239MFX8_9RHOB|nr:hypothetical protein [Tropicimonas sediminicola]SNT41083.1 hypothetical protein SAMN05421757_1183 [Tropicimonas sediminicola]
MPLDLPWNMLVGVLDWELPWLAIIAPLLNPALFRAISRALNGRRAS